MERPYIVASRTRNNLTDIYCLEQVMKQIIKNLIFCLTAVSSVGSQVQTFFDMQQFQEPCCTMGPSVMNMVDESDALNDVFVTFIFVENCVNNFRDIVLIT